MKRIFHYICRHLGLFFTAIFFLTIEAIADLLQPAMMERVVDQGVKYADTRLILHYGALMLLIAAVGALGAVMRNLFAVRTSQIISKEMRSDLYRKVQTFSLENIDRLQPAFIITRITNDVTQIQDFVNGCMRIMVKAPITCIGAIVLLALQTPWQIPVMAGILLIAGLFIWANIRRGYPRFGIMQQKLDRLNKVSREFLSSVRVVKAFGAEQTEEEKFELASRDLAGATTAAMRVMAVFGPLINLTVNLGIVLLLWLSQNSSAEIGHLMASVNYMTQILFSLGMVSNILNTAARAAASSRRIGEILDEVPAQIPGRQSPEQEWCGEVRFSDVSFHYAGAGQEALSHVTFCAGAGQTIGIIGPTGSGKSTLVNLIPRFYDATGGTVTMDGLDVTWADAHALRSAVAVVPQKALLFTGTILENLRWGKPDATREQAAQAARLACADDFIRQMPQGYDTVLTQGGAELSQGERQLLTIARAVLANAPILILDEATSSVDTVTEQNIRRVMLTVTEGRTSFIIAHRLSTIRDSDQIALIDGGRVQELGSHRELMALNGQYAALYRTQMGLNVPE